jgi:hypothetical protein
MSHFQRPMRHFSQSDAGGVGLYLPDMPCVTAPETNCRKAAVQVSHDISRTSGATRCDLTIMLTMRRISKGPEMELGHSNATDHRRIGVAGCGVQVERKPAARRWQPRFEGGT